MPTMKTLSPLPPLSALTFNIKVGVDSHPKDLARDLLAIERQRGPLDLISLQEVGRCWQMGAPIHQARYLASALRQQSAHFAPALTDSLGGNFGVALTARAPLMEPTQWLLPRDLDEQRTLLRCQVTPEGWPKSVTVFITHLSVKQAEREAQTSVIAQKVKEHTGPVIVLGDLNDHPDSLSLTTLKKAGLTDHWPERHGDALGYSFSVKDPNRRIDYLLTRGLRCTALELLTWVKSSDHFPLWGRFELEEE